MRRSLLFYLLIALLSPPAFAQQSSVKYSAVNPGLLLYNKDDVTIVNPQKFENGKHIISPNPSQYPWESRLENGMPNVLVSEYGDVSIYLSSFIAFAAKPPSKVGALAYTNNTNFIKNWTRPDAGLYWYDPKGATSDEKIKPEAGQGREPTNIVAVDIESVGIFDNYNLSQNGIKLIYLPQRESHNSIISGYEMNKSFNPNGVLSGFTDMKYYRQQNQFNFTFNFINGDTHMGYLLHDNNYSFVSRLNAKRSYLKEGETLPLKPDARKRYRRETITPIGPRLVSEHVDLNIALDMSTPRWEPYSMQPMQLPDFKNDIWWGLVTMFGTEGDTEVQHKQRTELAISNDGFHWRYLKPGTPFLDNGTDPNADDYGCINIAIPVNNTKFSEDSRDLFYFYASSNQRHVTGRNPGISVAVGKSGKWAGLTASTTSKDFKSSIMSDNTQNMPKYSLYYALYLGNESFPKVLSSVTENPTGKMLTQLSSYAALLIHEYDSTKKDGIGLPFAGSLGNIDTSTGRPSDNYESVGFIKGGMNGNSKEMIFNYLRNKSQQNPTKIISVKEMEAVPVVIQGLLKNASFFGISFTTGGQDIPAPLDLSSISNYVPDNTWTYSPTTGEVYTCDFSGALLQPNQLTPVNRTTGTISITAIPRPPRNSQQQQTILRMYGDTNNNNNISISLDGSGNIVYNLIKDGQPFAQMNVTPPSGKSFYDHEISIFLEVVPPAKRKYGTGIKESVAVLTVKCPDLNFEQSVPQPILWNWKHPEGSITDSDKANAQAFAFLEFTSFTPSIYKLTIGASDEAKTDLFSGTIQKVQIADALPTGATDFWN